MIYESMFAVEVSLPSSRTFLSRLFPLAIQPRRTRIRSFTAECFNNASFRLSDTAIFPCRQPGIFLAAFATLLIALTNLARRFQRTVKLFTSTWDVSLRRRKRCQEFMLILQITRFFCLFLYFYSFKGI